MNPFWQPSSPSERALRSSVSLVRSQDDWLALIQKQPNRPCIEFTFRRLGLTEYEGRYVRNRGTLASRPFGDPVLGRTLVHYGLTRAAVSRADCQASLGH
ncbi:hypothetical protein CC2G_013058 [Coprinopsis cinerea AmutBmut pab1-1]|nr:hypothetical protein CC2G_013058 [Coprinopsis cinerea AmutBmut pab1-1]